MSAAHSKLGASSMYRWSACPGSVRASEGIEGRTSSYAQEGTDAHAVAAHCLRNDSNAFALVTSKPFKDGDREFLVTMEMAEAVQVYVDTVFDLKEDLDALLVEQKFDLSEVHPGCFGTADAVIWKPATKTLIVLDYKHGAGIPVRVEANPQLQYYGLGALLATKHPAEKVKLGIVQPRCELDGEAVRFWEIDAIDLLDFRADLVTYAKATEAPSAKLVPGDHCRFCPAAPTCPAIDAKRQEVCKLEFTSAVDYEPTDLKKALDSRPVIQAWLKALDEFAYAEAEAGRCPDGYKLVAKRATRKWRDAMGAAMTFQSVGVQDDFIYEPREMRSPAQLEKLLPKAATLVVNDHVCTGKQLVAMFTTAESSGHVLVTADDKRPAIKLAAKDEFTAIPPVNVFED